MKDQKTIVIYVIKNNTEIKAQSIDFIKNKEKQTLFSHQTLASTCSY